MNTLLIFFALPIAVIIFSVILQKLFRCPFIVASIIFAIFLIVAVIIGTFEAVIAAIAYTLLSLLTAYIVMLICRINWNNNTQNDISVIDNNGNNSNGGTCSCNQNDNTITVSANIQPTNNTNGRRGRFYGTYR